MAVENQERTSYIIRGGIEGRERLRILSRVMRPSTLSLLQRVGVRPGMECLDVGCGGGDVSFDLARLVAPGGRVLGLDLDETKISMAQREAAELKVLNAEFRRADIDGIALEAEFDFAFSRFLLTHLRNPAAALARIRRALRPGGLLVAVDIDFRGYFCHPEIPAFRRYVELYTDAARRRGADPNIGPRLPGLLTAAGFVEVEMNIVQPAGRDLEIKLVNPLTLENIADAVIAEGLASRSEIERLVAELYEFARDPETIGAAPRIVEAWGYRPGEAAEDELRSAKD